LKSYTNGKCIAPADTVCQKIPSGAYGCVVAKPTPAPSTPLPTPAKSTPLPTPATTVPATTVKPTPAPTKA
ncbi:hypothetical protein ACHHYP_20371, partial [Achlya hypogyna]